MHKVRACQEICNHFLQEYLATAKEWKEQGKLCPHNYPQYVERLEGIMETVKCAHDMIEVAMKLMGMKPHHDDPHMTHHADALTPPTHASTGY